MPNAVIISGNAELIRFFELELEACGYLSRECRSFAFLQGEYDFLIVDTDSVKIPENTDISKPVIRVTSTPLLSESNDGYTVQYPALLPELRVLFSRICENGNFEYTASSAISLDTVYVTDKENCIISMGNRSIKLSKTEFFILCELCAQGGETVEREKIMDMLGAEQGNIADVYICNLRKKLEKPIGKRLIFTERGKGYRTKLRIIE